MAKLTLKRLRNKMKSIDSLILDTELNRLMLIINNHEDQIEVLRGKREIVLKEQMERDANEIPNPFHWRDDPVVYLGHEIKGSEVLIKKLNKKVKLIETELSERILMGEYGGVNV